MIKVGSYYELKLNEKQRIAFAVLYGFDSGKNKDVYALMMYTDKKNFEFPVHKRLFNKWVKEKKVSEITSDEALSYAL